MFVELKEL